MSEINGWEDLRGKIIEEEFSDVPIDSRNTTEFEQNVNARVWENIRESLLEELQGRGIPFRITHHNINDDTSYWTRNERGIDGKGVYEIDIPIGQEFSNDKNPYDERDLFGIVYSLFHEYKHIMQREYSIYNPINTTENRDFARAALIQDYFKEYDDENYANDPREVDAQLYGIEQALMYIRKNYPWVDVEKCCVDYVKSFISSQKEGGFTELSFSEYASDSSEQILQDLRERKNNQRRTKLSRELIAFEFYDGFEDEDLEKGSEIYKGKQLRKKFTDDFIKKYNECQNAKEKDNMLASAILEVYPKATQEYPIFKMEKNKGGKSKMDIDVQEKASRNREKISKNKEDIADCENEIEQLENEIKGLKQQGQSTYTQVLEKRLQIAELEKEIIDIQSISDRSAKSIILDDLHYIKKDGKQYQEHLHLSDCYTYYYEVQSLEATREVLELKMRLMVANKQQNSQEYKELQSEFKQNEQTLSLYRESLNKAVQLYDKTGGKQGTNIDFSVPYTDILEQYERENQVPNKTQNVNRKNSSDLGELANDLMEFTVGKYYQNREQEKSDIENNAKKELIPIFTDGLNGEYKQLAEVYGEIFSEGIATFAAGTLDNSISSKADGVFSRVILLDSESNKYCLVYERDDGTQIGITCMKNSETGKFEYYENSMHKKNNDGFISQEQIEDFSTDSPYITREQMEMQVVKHNIEESIQDGNVTEIVEVTDPKIVQYLNQQNGLSKYSARDDVSKVYMISRQDKDGNSHYEFVAHNGSQGYTKLEGLQQVPNKQNSIIIDGSRIPGQPTPMQRVDCTFIDKEGNSYFAYHQFGQGEMALSYSEQGKENADKVEVSKDSGLNRMLHNSRVRSLMRTGYNAMGIGYEKVKSIYNKFKGKDKENEVENTRED